MLFLAAMILVNIGLIYWLDIDDGLTQVLLCLATTIGVAMFL